jgi:hypothetical protein
MDKLSAKPGKAKDAAKIGLGPVIGGVTKVIAGGGKGAATGAALGAGAGTGISMATRRKE